MTQQVRQSGLPYRPHLRADAQLPAPVDYARSPQVLPLLPRTTVHAAGRDPATAHRPGRRLFHVYQYIAPLILFPLAYYLWYWTQQGNVRLAAFVVAIPVIWAYVIPGIGTNKLQIWEFHTRMRIGRFRPHHGFVFGSATSLFALATLAGPARELTGLSLLQAGFLLGSVLALWNWLYDWLAIQAGFITVYNRPFACGKAPEAIAADYAPVLFGVFGFSYGVAVRCAQVFVSDGTSWTSVALATSLSAAATIALPVLAYMAMSFLRYGDFGLQAYSPDKENNP